jgi:hypothetical protein
MEPLMQEAFETFEGLGVGTVTAEAALLPNEAILRKQLENRAAMRRLCREALGSCA